MSFKSFNCVIAQGGITPIPPEGWSVQGDTLIVSNDTTLQGYFECDPNLSGFIGANNISSGMTQSEFNELWPLLTAMLIGAACIRKVIHVFYD